MTIILMSIRAPFEARDPIHLNLKNATFSFRWHSQGIWVEERKGGGIGKVDLSFIMELNWK